MGAPLRALALAGLGLGAAAALQEQQYLVVVSDDQLLGGLGLATATELNIVDDTPRAEVPLEFPFPFFDGTRETAFVTANGAVEFDSEPACGAHFGGSTGGTYCSPGYAYYDLVGAFLADLNPSADEDSDVSYESAEDYFVARWTSVPFYSTGSFGSASMDFAVALYPSGRVRVELDDVHAIFSAYPVVGLRPPEGTAITNPSTAAMDAWETSREGFYPLPSLLGDGSAVEFCPVPLSVCLSPWAAPAEAPGTLSVSGQFFGCTDAFVPFCEFGDLGYSEGAFSADATTVSCPVVAPSGNETADLTVEVVVKLGRSYAAAEAADFGGLYFTYIVNSTTTVDDAAECNVHGDVCVCGECGGSDAGACVGCSDAAGEQLLTEDCAGVCGGSALDDADGSCCAAADLDCLGYCDGSHVLTQDSYYSSAGICAACTSTVDCAGVCRGSADIDACGVCSGGITHADTDVDCLGVCNGTATAADCVEPCYVSSWSDWSEICIQGVEVRYRTIEDAGDGDCPSVFDQRDCGTDVGDWNAVLIATSSAIVSVIVCMTCCCRYARQAEDDWQLHGAGAGVELQRRRTVDAAAIEALPTAFYRQGDRETVCPICLDDYNEDTELRVLPCHHRFHLDCIAEWLNTSTLCPMCKQDVLAPSPPSPPSPSSPPPPSSPPSVGTDDVDVELLPST